MPSSDFSSLSSPSSSGRDTHFRRWVPSGFSALFYFQCRDTVWSGCAKSLLLLRPLFGIFVERCKAYFARVAQVVRARH